MLERDHPAWLRVAAQLGTAALLLAGCAGRPASLDRAQAAVDQATADPQLQQYAPAELERARSAMRDANRAAAAGAERADLDSQAYAVQRKVEVARAAADARRSRAQAHCWSAQAQARAHLLPALGARASQR